MAFTAGVGLNKNLNRSNNNSTPNSRDEMVIIDDYDISKATMYAHRADPKNPRQFEITIKKSEVLRADEALKNKGGRTDTYGWMGHSIDEKMKKKFPAGSTVILTRAAQVAMNKESGRAVLEAHRISSVNHPEKTFTGIFSLSARIKDGVDRVSRIQSWAERGIDVNNTAGLEVLRDAINEAAGYYGQKMGEISVTKPSIGFQFRTLRKTGKDYEFAKDDTPKEILEAVDFSIPFDWMPGQPSESGSAIRGTGHLVTGDEMMQYAEDYTNYIRNHPAFKDQFEDLKIEVCSFEVYLASSQDNMQLTFNNHLDIHKDKNPLYQLAHRKSFIDIDQTEMLEGRNAAVNGILQVTADKIEKIDGKLVEIPNNWAVKLHANNYRGHVHAFVRTQEGGKVIVHPSLNFIKSDATPAANNPISKTVEVSKQEVSESTASFKEEQLFDGGFLNTDNDNLFE